MYGLTSLTPSQSDRAWQPNPDADLEIGKIYFDQVIGTQHVQTITRIDPVLPQALEAVSYTHLDVYKRQVYCYSGCYSHQ